MKVYKLLWQAKLACWVARRLPNMVLASIWIDAYDDLDDHYVEICELSDDGSKSLYDGISAIKVETLRRKLYKDYLHATIVDNNNNNNNNNA